MGFCSRLGTFRILRRYFNNFILKYIENTTRLMKQQSFILAQMMTDDFDCPPPIWHFLPVLGGEGGGRHRDTGANYESCDFSQFSAATWRRLTTKQDTGVSTALISTTLMPTHAESLKDQMEDA